MAPKKTDIIVYAHWHEMPKPIKMGVLTAQEARGHLAWSFAYEEDWLNTQSQLQLDPDLQWFTGPQYSKDDKPNFGMFLDLLVPKLCFGTHARKLCFLYSVLWEMISVTLR